MKAERPLVTAECGLPSAVEVALVTCNSVLEKLIYLSLTNTFKCLSSHRDCILQMDSPAPFWGILDFLFRHLSLFAFHTFLFCIMRAARCCS